MNVEERILLERITSVAQLSEAEQRLVQADEYLQQLIADNALLEDAADVDAAEPRRMALLNEIACLAELPEQNNTGLMGLLGGPGGRLRAVLACALLLAVIGLASLLPLRPAALGPQPAWASSDGYTIVYELAGQPAFSSSESGLNHALDDWRSEFGQSAGQLALRVRSAGDETRVALSARRVNEHELQRLVSLIEERTGMRDPQVTGTTLFEPAGPGPAQIVVQGQRDPFPAADPALGRIADLFAGESANSPISALVHGGGGSIYLGRFSPETQLDHSLQGMLPPQQILSVAQGECRAEGSLALFGEAARPSADPQPGSFSFRFHVNMNDPAHDIQSTADASGNAVADGFWVSDQARPFDSHGGYGMSQSFGNAAPSCAVAWVGDGGASTHAWLAEPGEGNLSWTPATEHGEYLQSFFSTAPEPSRFIVMDDAASAPAAFPGAADFPSGFRVWAPQPEGGSGYSYQVLESSQGNNELLPGFTIFGSQQGLRVFSFPPGAQAGEIQQRLDEWYERNGRRISLNVNLAQPLDDELLLLVAEGLDSDQSLIILGGTNDVAVAGVPAAPERKQDDQEEKQKQDEKPAQEKKQKDK
ncbi:hypothetical protein KDL44_04185 [bacterium]|nr:hypothetical protein [bacterium]